MTAEEIVEIIESTLEECEEYAGVVGTYVNKKEANAVIRVLNKLLQIVAPKPVSFFEAVEHCRKDRSCVYKNEKGCHIFWEEVYAALVYKNSYPHERLTGCREIKYCTVAITDEIVEADWFKV